MIGCREREVHDCCLKSYGVFYFSNTWFYSRCGLFGGKKEHCSDNAAPGGYAMAVFTGPVVV